MTCTFGKPVGFVSIQVDVNFK